MNRSMKPICNRMTCLAYGRSALLACLLLLSANAAAYADVKLPNIFSDHMVLQQGQANKLWGRDNPNQSVNVTFGTHQLNTKADAKGDWSVMLPSMTAGGPHSLTVEGSSKVQVSDILVGEVWICSGQSNMQWNVASSNDADLERLSAKYPNIRMINYPNVGTQEPVWSHDNHRWMVTTPESVNSFSAVGYFFARQLHQTTGVPVGMINNAWGGSAAEAWVNRETMKADTRYAKLLEGWKGREARFEELSKKSPLEDAEKKELEGLKQQMGGNFRPGNIYNGVLKSHVGYGIKGAIWYQGESNAGRAYQYRDLFPFMIANWRAEWGQGDFPFYWVQLADFMGESPEPKDSAWAELREAQTMSMDRVPNSGQAVIIDIGEGKDIHPMNKVDVGRRLARWALAKQYGIAIDYESPRYASMEKVDGGIVLAFKSIGPGWRPFDVDALRGFTIADESKKFVPAVATIVDGNKIKVMSNDVTNPVAVRYAWADNPVCNVYSRNGLPLTPFRTDDWPGVTVNNE